MQEQFLTVVSRDEAEARFRHALRLEPLGSEFIDLTESLGRVLAEDIRATVDVPSFDRSNFDGFALRAADTFGADELRPMTVRMLSEHLEAGIVPDFSLQHGFAAAISTCGMIPRGADAVLMIEHAEAVDDRLLIRRPVTPGHGITFTGTDIALGETVLRAGTLLSSRETGVLAAIGMHRVSVLRRPTVLIISTGNEVIAPGETMRPGLVFDSNSQVLSDAMRELGGIPVVAGIIRDDVDALRMAVRNALAAADVVLLSGGTSKGRGDLCYRVVAEFSDPGIVAHGVALKPGKPLCLAVTQGKPVVILPGFPTSAIFTFHEFVAPVIRILGGYKADLRKVLTATMAVRTNSEIGRTEYLLVGLVEGPDGLSGFPMGKGSGSVTTFGRADGFVTIDRNTEIVPSGQSVQVQLLGKDLSIADLTVIGSHCVGLDYLLSEMQRQGFRTKLLTVGSSAGLAAASRGECDLAGIHLLHPASGEYNRAFVSDPLELINGYVRQQGIVFRRGDMRFEGRRVDEIAAEVVGASGCAMINRNQGSGTRILIDLLLAGRQPEGYAVQPGNHNAVIAAVAQGRADWGVAIESVAQSANLMFLPIREEHFDFVIPKARRDRPAVIAFRQLLHSSEVQARLAELGCHRKARGESATAATRQ